MELFLHSPRTMPARLGSTDCHGNNLILLGIPAWCYTWLEWTQTQKRTERKEERRQEPGCSKIRILEFDHCLQPITALHCIEWVLGIGFLSSLHSHSPFFYSHLPFIFFFLLHPFIIINLFPSPCPARSSSTPTHSSRSWPSTAPLSPLAAGSPPLLI